MTPTCVTLSIMAGRLEQVHGFLEPTAQVQAFVLHPRHRLLARLAFRPLAPGGKTGPRKRHRQSP